MTCPFCPHSTRRVGVTLIELVLVLVVGGLIATVAFRTFRSQQRSVGGTVALAEMRAQLRQGLHVLASELRAISPADGDVLAWTRTGIVLRSVIGSSVVCRRESDTTLVLPPLGVEHGDGPTSWLTMPQPGDSLRVLDEARELSASDDAWPAYEIYSLAPVAAGEECTRWPGDGPGPAPTLRIRLGGEARVPSTVSVGASIRIFRPARYELYRSGDGSWYLGASECRAGRLPACSTIQPVSGPYRPLRRGGEGSGLELAYFDRFGDELDPDLADARHIARIDVTVRAESMPSSVWNGMVTRALRDSLHRSVAPRPQTGRK